MTAHCYIDSLRHEGVNLRVRGVAGAANQKRESSSKLEGKKNYESNKTTQQNNLTFRIEECDFDQQIIAVR